MPSLLNLSPELLLQIVGYVDRESLKDLRLVCRSFRDIGRRHLFQSAQVSPTNESCALFKNILDHPGILRDLRKVYLTTIDWDYKISDEDYEEDPGVDLSLPQQFTDLLKRLKDIPRLRSVVFRFNPKCCGTADDEHWWADDCDETTEFRAQVLKVLMALLVSLPEPLQELGIWDLQNINPEDAETVENTKKVLGNLRSLRLNITNEHDEGNGEHDLEKEEPHSFFPALPKFWLQPTTSTLQHLTLYSSNYFGFYPKLDLRDVHFPQLKTLAFGNYAFVHDSQFDWIISHGSTLTELFLDDCPILYDVAIDDKERHYLDPKSLVPREGLHVGDTRGCAKYERRWHQSFDSFAEGLPHLRHFRYGSCPSWWEDDTTPFERETEIKLGVTKESYMVFCDGYGPSPYMTEMIYMDDWDRGENERPKCLEEDMAALKRLCAKTGQVDNAESWTDPDM